MASYLIVSLKEFIQEDSTAQAHNNSQPINSGIPVNVAVSSFIGFSILVPIILFTGFKFYKKYRVAVLRQQKVALEKQWYLDIKKKSN